MKRIGVEGMIPGKFIDNDLFGTDYTIGYDTVVNTAMGWDAGFIALKTAWISRG
jgi:6-phosphofructokinase